MHHTRLFTVACVLAYLCALCSVCAQERPPWWNNAWRYRKKVTIPAQGRGPYCVWVYTGNRALPDGRDIRVVDHLWRPAPFGILRSTDEGKHLIVFGESQPPMPQPGKDATPPARSNTYYVYFGNASAPAVQQVFPRAGLTLETRAIPEKADVSSWQAASETLRNSTSIYGMDFWGQPSDAYNPFGPQADYISIYCGYINCSKAGLYKFATDSVDASFLLIDDELLAQWPGRGHNIHEGRQGQHSGQKKLAAGLHKFMYIAFCFGGPQPALAAWIPAGAEGQQWFVIPASAFPQATRLKPEACEGLGGTVWADFEPTPVNYLEVGEGRMVAVQFNSLSTALKGAVRSCKWEFGDGQTSTEPNPVHVFLFPRRHEVKLTVGSFEGGADSFGGFLNVQPLWADLDFERWKKDKFWGWTQNFVVPSLPTEHLLAWRELLRDMELSQKRFEVNTELDKRRAQLKPLEIYAVATELAQYYLDALHRWQTAENYYKLALDQCAADDLGRRFLTRFQLAELYLDGKGDLEQARQAYESLRKEFPSTRPRYRRIALMRLGDIKLRQAKLKEALEIYKEAENDPQFALSGQRRINEARFMQEVESYMKQGDGKQALAVLDEWLWFYPTACVEGETMALRLKINILLNNYQEVKKQAGIYIGFANEPDYLPQAHVLAGEACFELGQQEEARKYWQTVLDKWPESPAVKDAENGLYRLKK